MKVKTFLGENFDILCKQLADEVINKNYSPDIIVGILTGGGIIGRKSFEEFKNKAANSDVVYTELKLQRPSTKMKAKKKVNSILTILPLWFLNFLRVAEVYYYEIKVRFVKPQREGILVVEDLVDKKLKMGGNKVLIIDDCIDTGYTLKTIKDYLLYNYPGNDFRIAVATVSHHFPVVLPEYQLYDRVLLRFPWANDVKHSQ